jgi:hypothetical protein
MKWYDLAGRVIDGYDCTVRDARDILATPDLRHLN